MLRVLLAAMAISLAAGSAKAEVRLAVAYSESADLYSLMDNVSGWLDGYVMPPYREEWERRFGWSDDDQRWADRYQEYRQRTFLDDAEDPDPAMTPDGIFASRTESAAGADPLATYFLAQPDIRTALSQLERSASPNDARMLRGFYQHFEPKWRVLLGESAPLKAQARRLQEKLNSPKVQQFVQRMNRFYGGDVDGQFTVYFTRHPPGRETSAEPLAGSYILLHSPTADESQDWDTIVMHELAHFISSRQPAEQKHALTARFLARCPMPKGAKRMWLIEEPLAVAWGQAVYSAEVLNTPLDPNDNWYGIPWVNIVSRAIAPSVIRASDSEAPIDTALVDEAADRCVDLTKVAAALDRQPVN